jgi:hypothetical protein
MSDMSEHNESEEQPESTEEEFFAALEESTFNYREQLKIALEQPGLTLTHVAAVGAYTDEDGSERILIFGGPEQPAWLTKAVLEKGIDVWDFQDQLQREAALSAAAYSYEIVGEDDEDDEDDE